MIGYMISDGNGKYIRKDFAGQYSPVRSEALADTWSSKAKAQNVLCNQINKNMRKRYKIVETNTGAEAKQSIGAVSRKSDIISSAEKSKRREKKIKELSEDEIEDSQLDKWAEGIDSFGALISDMEKRKETLSEDLSNADKEISDIQHYIEFGTFNAYQGWLAFSMLRHRLQKRRKIKNELQILLQIERSNMSSATVADIQNAIHKLDEKSYKPRILRELFE